MGDKAGKKRLLVWFQDEARVGQQGTTTRSWAPKGTRLRAVKQQGFEWAYVFGAVCPESGRCEGVVMPRVNTEAMNRHMALLSSRLQPDEHAVLVCDRAPWHRSKGLHVPDNISLLLLPPYSPELNPVEQVWQWMRQRFWANRVFTDFDDVVHACCQAWNAFASLPTQVTSLCTRIWAKTENYI